MQFEMGPEFLLLSSPSSGFMEEAVGTCQDSVHALET